MIEDFEASATKCDLAELFRIKRVIPSIDASKKISCKMIAATSLYAVQHLQPIVEGAGQLQVLRPEISFRIYLAADLEDMIDPLLAVGCDVFLMEDLSTSENFQDMWRFLALSEKDVWVTITDAQRARSIFYDVERTELIQKTGHGLWRAPYVLSHGEIDSPGVYRPIMSCQFGAKGGINIENLIRAHIWNTARGTLRSRCTIAGKEAVDIEGCQINQKGFGEWFLLSAFYPRIAADGVMTFRSWDDNHCNAWYALDIEYVTWANPQSEIFYYGSSKFLESPPKVNPPKVKPRPKPKSIHAVRLITEAKSIREIYPPAKSKERVTLCVARYEEDIDWLLQLEDDINIVLYNKGSEIKNKALLKRINSLIPLKNQGREADTYLRHIRDYKHRGDCEWTVFCQGEPFSHSPDFLDLIKLREHWREVQSLTACYMDARDIPPSIIIKSDLSEYIKGKRCRTEFCTIRTMEPMHYFDHGNRNFMMDFCNHHNLPDGWSIGGYFLEKCGLDDLAKQAWDATLMQFSFGAMFAVRNNRLGRLGRTSLNKMIRLACGHHSAGFVYERMWLHFFGQPFIKVERSYLD
ncbi:MAG: hypothetical protein B9S37_10090 [Verrucomicrobiia bacterium Tous-C3TDCM]|nr:MAG: hypothetical protein B9S37_10090 [Verrucomicrobiae bacterium Tous-C3TDCM]